MRLTVVAVLASIVAAPGALAQPKPQPPVANTPAELKTAINDLHVLGNDFWVYNDLAAAKAEARRQNKPIFVTFRCVPCKACAGFDAEVAKGSEGIKQLASEKFVSLRQVEMKGVDLNQFQFDHDLNWAAMFINADGTVYGRYGTQSADGPDAYNSIASLEKAMHRVLDLHAKYEQVKDSLAAKKGAPKPYANALEMPGMENKAKLAGPTARNNCVHCHMIHDAEQKQWRDAGQMSEEKLYRFPLPDNVGLHIDKDDGRKVERVLAGSPADNAGLKPGDVVTHVNGQPVVSIADVQWPLHNTPNEDGATVAVTVDRAGATETKTLALAKGWKKTDYLWRGSRWSLRPEPGFWAPALDDKAIKALGAAVPDGTKPIRVQFIANRPPQGPAVQQAGMKTGDVILAVNGKPLTQTPAEFQMWVRLNCKKGDVLTYTILRDKKQMEVKVPLME